MAAAYVVAGVTCCILFITIPFGIASLRIAGYALWPFGRAIVRRSDAGAASALGDLVWFVFAGFWLAIGHVVTRVARCVTIIGIPFGIANFKTVPISLIPLGRVIVPTDPATVPLEPSRQARCSERNSGRSEPSRQARGLERNSGRSPGGVGREPESLGHGAS